jgi:nucleoside-triphosphatase THEP1
MRMTRTTSGARADELGVVGRSYLLRVRDGGERERFELLDLRSGRRMEFATFAELQRFVEAQRATRLR